MSQGRRLEIAIVGMGCRFPGARDLCAYWENILGGKDCTREVPPDRWDPGTFVDRTSPASDRVPCGRGASLDSPIAFDASEHGIMPRTIEGSEPEQFLVLDAATDALADAGLALDDLEGRRVEIVIDRGMIALDLAARALVERRADLAIVGGAYLEADSDFPPLVFRQLSAVSPSGRARPFAADADGMLSGEGVGVLVLKRRADAERAGDRIYALVQGLGLASDGRSRGLAVPGARGHARAIRRAYRRSGIDPASVMLVEGHGLGVSGADRAELRALDAVFPPPSHGRRTLGAVSSKIGHTMPAADMAGLIKTALAVYHRVLPPTLDDELPHPLLQQPGSAFALNTTARPWIHPDPETPRRAGVNSVGFAGINAHAVLEEHVASADSGVRGALRHWETEAILLSAPDRAGLIERARELIDWLDRHPRATLKDVAYTLNRTGEHPPGAVAARLGLVASSLADLAGRLGGLLPRLGDPACRTIRDGCGVYYWDEPLLNSGSGGLAFLFPGEGSQYPGMLADLCFHFPEVLSCFDISDRIALELGETVPPSEHLFGSLAEGREQLWSTTTAVNVVLTSQWALYQVLTRLGLRPDAVSGHSSGELLALAAASVLQTDRELERQLGRLGSIFRGFESSGDMPAARLVAVAAGRERVETFCRELSATDVVVAIDNCPHQVVLAGPPAAVERVVHHLRRENILWEDLPFERAYHTTSFAPVLGPIEEFFAQLTFRPPCLPIYSCAARGLMPADPAAIRELAVSQWTRTVAFRETIAVMHADGLRVFIDVGARGNLAGFVEDTLRGKPAFAVAANLPRRSGLTQLNHLMAATFAQGAPVEAEFLYARRRPCAIDWSEPEHAPRTTVEFTLGCPEIRLPESLVARLLVRPGGDPVGPCSPAGRSWDTTSVPAGTAGPSADDWPQPEEPARNGAAHSEPAAAPAVPSEVDSAMLAFQDTMQAFLQTQQEIMTAYLSDTRWPAATGCPTVSGPEPGPWVGEVRRLVVESEVETVYVLDARDDPIAENHTLGGRRVSALDPSSKGLPVLPFAVMAEMTAQAAALVVSSGLILIGLEQVGAHKWVRYEPEPVYLELRGQRVPSSDDERVRVSIFNRGPDGRAEAPRPVFEAVAVFAESLPSPPPAAPWALEKPRTSRFTAESLYAEQWLFHGPDLQALVEVGPLSERGIAGRLHVLPWEPLVKRGQLPRLHTDLIVLDSFTHLLGCWGLDTLAEGDVVFPLRMGSLEIHGDRPPIGTDVACRIAIREIQRHRVRVQAEIVRPDGTVWMRIHDWEDWRFHWPGRYRDVFRQPQEIFLGEELPLDDPSRGPVEQAKAVWLAPPADMGRPVWRDVLEQTQLGPAERAAHLAPAFPDRRRAQRLWGRIAAKEAARRIWQAEGRPATYPADLAVVADERGRPRLTRVELPDDLSLPAISIAYTDGVSVALAALDRAARIGIDVEAIVDRGEGFEASAFTLAERVHLSRWYGSGRAEWIARFGCAKEAAAKATGSGLAADPTSAEIVGIDEESGVLQVRLDLDRLSACPDRLANPLRVVSARRGEYAWAWTLGEGAELS